MAVSMKKKEAILVFERKYPFSPEKVFRFITDPDRPTRKYFLFWKGNSTKE